LTVDPFPPQATQLIGDAGAGGAPATLEDFMREQEETRTQRALPAIEQCVARMERSLARLVADVQKAEDTLAKEVGGQRGAWVSVDR
jgi:hypothetical protein